MFYFHLAAHLKKTVRQLLAELDSRELAEWKAFDRLSPIDHVRRAEVSAGTVAAAVVAPYCRTTPKASDFIRNYAADWTDAHVPAPEPTPEQLEAKIDAFFGGLG
jgi:hypothetical protein